MPRAKKTARMSTGGYYPTCALVAPQAPQEDQIVVISDDEEILVLEEDPVLVEDFIEKDAEEWITSTALAPAPAPVPAPALEPHPEEVVQVPAPVAPEVEDGPG